MRAYRANHLSRQLGLAEHFDGIIASCDLGFAKPEPEFYSLIASAIQTPPDRILFWDDSKAAVEGALNAGWQACLYTTYDDFVMKMHSSIFGRSAV